MNIEIYEVMNQAFNYMVITPRGKQYLFRVERYEDKWLWESESGNAERLPKSVCMKIVKVTEALNI